MTTATIVTPPKESPLLSELIKQNGFSLIMLLRGCLKSYKSENFMPIASP
jgi:hypothetical protein